ncbi:hypothetical protein J3F83DRAFT_764128 [Trichoderma novae-zelandiae]
MDPPAQNPLFHALDIILAYLNHGNSRPEIEFLASAAASWCRHHHLAPLDDPFDDPEAAANLDDVLCTHPNLFDLSIRSFARLYAFDHGGRPSRILSQAPALTHRTVATLLLSSPAHAHAHAYIRPLLTAQHFFSAVIDAYTLSVGGKGRSFHDRIVAQDLKASPIIHYMPDVVRRIAALDTRELLTTQFSTFSPKTSLGFSCYLAKGLDIVMMDAPPIIYPGESDSHVEWMDIDDAGPPPAGLAAANATKKGRTRTPRRQSQLPDGNHVSKSSPKRTPGPKGVKRRPSGQSRGRQSRGVRKKRKKKHE